MPPKQHSRRQTEHHEPPLKIGIFLADGVLGTSATLPIEILLNAEAFAAQQRGEYRRIAITTLSPDGEVVASASGFNLQPDIALDTETHYELIHIPGFWRSPRPALRKADHILSWLRHQYEQGAILTAVGTGVCFYAEAGLLDGKAATTHWHYFDRFQKLYPKVLLQRQYFTTQADNIYCAASANAMAELFVHIVYRIYGRETAQHVERMFFHEIRNTFEGRNYFNSEARQHPDEDILQAQIWIQDNLAKPITIKQLAQQFGMSVRTFNRRFRAAADKTPLAYLQAQRLDNARQLLQRSNATIAEIAHLCGYQDTTWFTQLFRKHHNVTPAQYRQTVRAKLFDPG